MLPIAVNPLNLIAKNYGVNMPTWFFYSTGVQGCEVGGKVTQLWSHIHSENRSGAAQVWMWHTNCLWTDAPDTWNMILLIGLFVPNVNVDGVSARHRSSALRLVIWWPASNTVQRSHRNTEWNCLGCFLTVVILDQLWPASLGVVRCHHSLDKVSAETFWEACLEDLESRTWYNTKSSIVV